jgi:hypothetical protein
VTHCKVWYSLTDVSEEHTGSVFCPEDGDSLFLRNMDSYPPDYIASCPSLHRKKVLLVVKIMNPKTLYEV